MERNQLIEARTSRKWSQAAVAHRLQVSLSHYEKIERGLRNPGVHLARAINELFGTQLCAGRRDDVVSAAEASAHPQASA